MKKWNKAATAALLTAFVMTGALPAQAEEAAKTETTQSKADVEQSVPADMIQKEQAIAKAREVLGGLQDLPYADAHYSENQDYFVNGPTWSVNLSSLDRNDWKAFEEARKKGPERTVYAYINAKTGELMHFQDQNPEWLGKAAPEKELAIRSADAFLKKVLAPEQLAILSKGNAFGGRSGGGYTDENGNEYMWTSSDVQYSEVVNGIPFTANSIQVGVDQYGHVVRYQKQFRFDSSKLPKPEGIVSKEVAKIELASRTHMELQYQTRTYSVNKDGDVEFRENPVLTYQASGITQIDAFTGKPSDMGFPMIDSAELTKHKVTGEGRIPTAKTKEEAAKIASSLLGIDMNGLVYEEPRKSPFDRKDENTPVTYIWHEDYEKRPQDTTNWSPLHVSASFDVKTGKLLQLYRNGGEGKKPAFTVEEGKTKAIDILKAYVPEGEQELMLTSAYDSNKPMKPPAWFDESKAVKRRVYETGAKYSYHFAPTHQGIIVSDLSYSVDINAETGQLITLRLPEQYDVKLPDIKDVANPEVVEATYLQNHPLTLQYLWYEYDGQQAPEGKLVYSLDYGSVGNWYIDAFTGHEVRDR